MQGLGCFLATGTQNRLATARADIWPCQHPAAITLTMSVLNVKAPQAVQACLMLCTFLRRLSKTWAGGTIGYASLGDPTEFTDIWAICRLLFVMVYGIQIDQPVTQEEARSECMPAEFPESL
jgi:hypothetical protein